MHPARLAFGATTTAVLEPGPGADCTAQVAADRAALLVVHGGTLCTPSRDELVTVNDGQGVVVMGAASVRLSSTDGCRVTAVDVPVATLAGAVLPQRSLVLVEDSGVLRPVQAFVQAMHSGGGVAAAAKEYIEHALHGMMRAGVSAAASVQRSRNSVADRAVEMIVHRHAEPTLTPGALADALNLSLRQLEREFLPRGRTIRQEIRRVRVSRAAALLRDGAQSRRSVDSIATEVGLSNGSSLARAMAGERMPSPTALRAEARAALAHT